MGGMKIGLGLYRQMLNDTHYKFAQQLGSPISLHLEDYFSANPKLAGQVPSDWGASQGEPWTERLFCDLIEILHGLI